MEIKRDFSPIEVVVKYSFRDYYSSVADHAPQVFKDLGKWGPPWLVRLIVPPIACVAAVWTGKLKPRYRFLISNDGITRDSDSGQIKKSWAEIRRIRTYSTSFLIEIDRGAMVLPFRLLNDQQLALLGQIFSAEVSED